MLDDMNNISIERNLLICRPCDLSVASELHDWDIFFWKRDWNDKSFLRSILKNRKSVYVEEFLAPLLHQVADNTHLEIRIVNDLNAICSFSNIF